MEEEIANRIYYLSEDVTYNIIENFNQEQATDKSLVYCFVKAFYIYIVQKYLESKKSKLDFDKIYSEYKEKLKSYYTTNNPNIDNEILDQVLNFFDNSFGLINTVELNNINDSYEFRHYTINVFELLRMILEKKSNHIIRENIFDNYIKEVIEQKEKIENIL